MDVGVNLRQTYTHSSPQVPPAIRDEILALSPLDVRLHRRATEALAAASAARTGRAEL